MQDAPSQAHTDRKVLLIHAAVYMAVNAVLAFINLSQEATEGQARAVWFIWPLAGWGIGLAAHALALALKKRASEASEGPGGLLEQRDVRGVAVHLFVYLAVNALLIVVNVTQTPQSFWAIWPLAGWGIGLGVHAFLVYRAVLLRTTEHYAREQLILREMQVERLATAIALTVSQEEQEAQEEAALQADAEEAIAANQAKKKRARKKQAAARKKTATAKRRQSKAAPGKTGAGKSRVNKKAANGERRQGAASSSKAPAKKPVTRRKRAAGKPAAQSAG